MSTEYSSATIVTGEKFHNSNEAPPAEPTSEGLSARERRDLGQALKRRSLD